MQPAVYESCTRSLLKIAATNQQMHEAISKMAPKGVHVMTDPTRGRVRENWGGGVFGPHHLLEEALGPSLKKRLPKGKIVMTSSGKDPITLAHEMGHAQFDESLIGRTVQNPYVRGLSSRLAPIAGAGVGYATGAATRSPLAGAAAGAAVSGIGHLPTLLSEGMASMRAVDNLRAAGASDAQVAAAKRDMGKWLLTYMKDPALHMAAGVIAGGAGGAA